MKKVFGLLSFLILGLYISACQAPGYSLPDQTQKFGQGIKFNNKVDILMMIDNSSSMLSKQTKLAAQVPAIVSGLDAQGLDYRIAIVNTDVRSGGTGGQYMGNPSILTKGMPGLTSTLQNRILQGETGSDLESGLQSMKLAIQADLADGVSTFMRDDAMLVLLILSDEDDFSLGTVDSYISFFNSVKKPFPSGNRSWLLNYIGILPNDPVCTTAGIFADPGARYLDIADATGGVKESICNPDFTNVVSNVRTRINQYLSDYYLDREPKIGTVVVTKNGVKVPESAANGWSLYQDPNNGKYFIRFSGNAIPAPTDDIKVTYSPASAT